MCSGRRGVGAAKPVMRAWKALRQNRSGGRSRERLDDLGHVVDEQVAGAGKERRMAVGDLGGEMPTHCRRHEHVVFSLPEKHDRSDRVDAESPRPAEEHDVHSGTAAALSERLRDLCRQNLMHLRPGVQSRRRLETSLARSR